MGIGIYLKSYVNSQGKSQLEIKCRDNKKQYTKTLFSIKREHWNPKTQRILATNPLAAKYNKALSQIKDTIYESFDLYKANLFTWQELIRRINGGDTKITMDNFLSDVLKSYMRENTYKNNYNSLQVFKRTLGLDKLLFSDINYVNISTFIRILKPKYAPASINHYIKNIASIVNEAYRRNITAEPFKYEKNYRQKERVKQAEVVTRETLETAINNVNTIYEFQSIALWMLSFCLRGLYNKDLAILHKMPLVNYDKYDKNRYIQHTRSKTGEPMRILYSCEPTESIINTLKKSFRHTHNLDVPYDSIQLFDYNVEDYSKHKSMFSVYGLHTKRLLGYSHKSSRKTFESIAVKLDISSALRYKLLGHHDSTIKRHYIQWLSDDLIQKTDEAHLKVLQEFNIAPLWTTLENRYYTITGDNRALRIA